MTVEQLVWSRSSWADLKSSSADEIYGILCSIKTYSRASNWPSDQLDIARKAKSLRVDCYGERGTTA
jgi:hypothetical protein